MLRKASTKIVTALILILMILAVTGTVLFLKNQGKEKNTEFAVIEGPKVASIQASTITRIIEGKPIKVKEEKILGWSFMDFNIQEISSKIKGDRKFIGAPNIRVYKTQDRDENEIVKLGDEINYTITAKNDGTAIGKTTIKDSVPVNSELNGNILLKVGNSEKTISKDELENGYLLTLNANEEARITFGVKVKGYSGNKITNVAKYQNEGENEKQTEEVTTKIESEAKVISTITTTEEVETPQKVILVLDISGSMNRKIGENSKDTKLEAMKSSVNQFLTKFLANGKNEVMIITYSEYAQKTLDKFTSSKDTAYGSISSLGANGGTNIDAGLTLANNSIGDDAKNTSVILMTDGLPCYYMVGDQRYQEGMGDTYTETPAKHAIDASTLIKNKGSKVYSIGFGLNSIEVNSKDKAKELMKKIASTEKEYYDSYDEEKLDKAFSDIVKSITTTTDSKPISYETTDGIITIKNSEEKKIFKAGQKVEIYLSGYVKDSSKADNTYSWEEFLALKNQDKNNIVQYNESEGTLKFNLGKYMEEEKISENKIITIRFVEEL